MIETTKKQNYKIKSDSKFSNFLSSSNPSEYKKFLSWNVKFDKIVKKWKSLKNKMIQTC